MNIMTNNDCIVEKSPIINGQYVFEEAGIIDVLNKHLLIITGTKLMSEYSKIFKILLNSASKSVTKIYFKICPMALFTNINGWLIKDNIAYSFLFSYNLGEYDNLNLDYHLPLREISNYGPPINNKINIQHFTKFPVAFLCLNAVGIYSIKYLKP